MLFKITISLFSFLFDTVDCFFLFFLFFFVNWFDASGDNCLLNFCGSSNAGMIHFFPIMIMVVGFKKICVLRSKVGCK